MIVTRYKPLFSLSASYELPVLGIKTEGVTVEAVESTRGKLRDFRLVVKQENNLATVYYEGIEKPVGAPTTSEPVMPISSEEFFYFRLRFANKEKINVLKFHTTTANAKENGFPLLYDARIDTNGGATQFFIRDEVKVMPPVFTFSVGLPQSGIAGKFAFLEIRDEKNILVALDIPPAALNDKSIDGVEARPEFAFSIDASSLDAGVYEFKVGNFKKKIFIATGMNLVNSVCLIRILKNNFLDYRKNLADNSFAKFDLLIPKA
jgi:hypothetical protein